MIPICSSGSLSSSFPIVQALVIKLHISRFVTYDAPLLDQSRMDEQYVLPLSNLCSIFHPLCALIFFWLYSKFVVVSQTDLAPFRLGVSYALWYSCMHLLLAPYPYPFVSLLPWGIFVVPLLLMGQLCFPLCCSSHSPAPHQVLHLPCLVLLHLSGV
jgi:hypothetical protein